MKSMLQALIVLYASATAASANETHEVRIENHTGEHICEISVDTTGELWYDRCLAPNQTRTINITTPDDICVVTIHFSFDDVGESIYDINVCTTSKLFVDSVHTYY